MAQIAYLYKTGKNLGESVISNGPIQVEETRRFLHQATALGHEFHAKARIAVLNKLQAIADSYGAMNAKTTRISRFAQNLRPIATGLI